jgi:hypothetical protein
MKVDEFFVLMAYQNLWLSLRWDRAIFGEI